MSPTSDEIREEIVEAAEAGENRREIARRLGVSLSTVTRVWRRYSKTDQRSPQVRERKGIIAKEKARSLLSMLRYHPEYTLLEYCYWWERKHGLLVSVATMSRTLAKLQRERAAKERDADLGSRIEDSDHEDFEDEDSEGSEDEDSKDEDFEDYQEMFARVIPHWEFEEYPLAPEQVENL